MPYLSPALNVMTTAARKAGRGLIRDFGELENLQVSLKGPADFVTAADKRTERILIQELSKARPGYQFLVEEAGAIEGPDRSHRFIIDPLDGTTNFLHGVPHFAISIALEREGQLVSAVVYNPVVDEMYTAEKNHGAYLNNKRLRVAARKHLKEAIVTTGMPYLGREGHEQFLEPLAPILAATPPLRRFGSPPPALPHVPAPPLHAFWERGLAAWDLAAGILLVREAGGQVSDLAGGARALETGDILAANDTLHPLLLKLLRASRGS
jgi:myo-inositol-1(or 4)-monophosphatase